MASADSISPAFPASIVKFWEDAGSEKWFAKDDAFDAAIKANYGQLIDPAVNGEFDAWQNEAQSCLALILILDQFPRNLFRDSAKAFAQDAKALSVAKLGIAKGYDKIVDSNLRPFLYMPFMHSENLADQAQCVELMKATGKQNNVKFAILHYDIIDRFARFPASQQGPEPPDKR